MANSEMKFIEKILNKYDSDELEDAIRNFTADDEDWDAGCIFPELADAYLKGNDDVRKGIDRACEVIFGYALNDLAAAIEDYFEELA